MTSPQIASIALALLVLPFRGSADDRVEVVPMRAAPAVQETVPGEYVVHFKTRSHDLSALRAANYGKKSAAEIDAIVAELERRTNAERASFAERIDELGGSVVMHYWIINASWIRIADDKRDAVAVLPGVKEVQPNYVWHPVLRDSTNASNHNSDAANAMTGKNGRVIGTNMAVAILDTGIDANMANTGRPHRSFYRNGDPNNRTGGGLQGSRILGRFVAPGASGSGEDDHSHGTMVSSCSASAWGNDSGFAPDAHIVSWKVSVNSGGGSNSGIIAAAWQQVLSNARRYNIVAGNNSYSGSPSFTETAQQAADSAALNGNINVCVPSGNSGSFINSTQAGYNGINTGSNEKYSSNRSSFSGFGTQSTGKVVPDVVAIGSSVIMTAFDRETSLFRASGTSFSSPSAAGAALLIRHADTALTALEAKALLLNHTRNGTQGGGRGAGVMLTNLAVDAAIKGQVAMGKLTTSQRSQTFFFQVQQNATHSVTATWFRTNVGVGPTTDLNLRILNPNGQQIGSSARSAANSYEKVTFTASQAGTYRAVVDGTFQGSQVDYAIAGAGSPAAPKKPALTGINPSQIAIFNSPPVTLTGTELQTVTEVTVGSAKVAPTSTTATTVVFDPPGGLPIGPTSVSVRNPAGTSNSVNATVVGAHPPVLVADVFLSSFKRVIDTFYCDKGWAGLYFLSGSNVASKLPGVIDLGIGNNFTDLLIFHTFVFDANGVGSLGWTVPPGFARLTFHQQLVAFDPTNPKFPLEVSNVVSRTILF